MTSIDRRQALLMSFAALLPLPAAARVLPDDQLLPAHATEPVRVLVIESDNPTSCWVEFTLQAEGMQVWTTELGEEGIDLALKYHYDVIVLTSHMVDINGMNVLKAIRAAGINTPVAFVLQIPTPEARAAALAAGASAFLVKPARNHELIAAVNAVVRPSTWVHKTLSSI